MPCWMYCVLTTHFMLGDQYSGESQKTFASLNQCHGTKGSGSKSLRSILVVTLKQNGNKNLHSHPFLKAWCNMHDWMMFKPMTKHNAPDILITPKCISKKRRIFCFCSESDTSRNMPQHQAFLNCFQVHDHMRFLTRIKHGLPK